MNFSKAKGSTPGKVMAAPKRTTMIINNVKMIRFLSSGILKIFWNAEIMWKNGQGAGHYGSGRPRYENVTRITGTLKLR